MASKNIGSKYETKRKTGARLLAFILAITMLLGVGVYIFILIGYGS